MLSDEQVKSLVDRLFSAHDIDEDGAKEALGALVSDIIITLHRIEKALENIGDSL